MNLSVAITDVGEGVPEELRLIVHGTLAQPISSSIDQDNEENTVRAAELLIRDAFRKKREKGK